MRTPRLLAEHGPSLFVGAVFATCSLVICPLMDAFQPNQTGAILVYSCFGVIGAAAALVAICAVLWPVAFWLRALMSFALGLLLFGFWLIGFAISSAGRGGSHVQDEWRTCTIVLLCLPLAFLAIQSPLWLTRLAFRWDVALVSHKIESPAMGPLTIRDMLAAMGLIGIGLAGARFAKPLAEQNGSSSEDEFWIWTAAALACCIGISLASTLPVVVATLRARKPALAMLGISIYAMIILAVTFTVLGIIERRTLRPWHMIGMSTTAATFTGAMAVPLMMVRLRGFRLRWGGESVGRLQAASRESHQTTVFSE